MNGWVRRVAASGAVLAALAVALSAYASHLASPEAAKRLALAAALAFGHGLASEAQLSADAPDAVLAGRTAADLVLELETRTGLRAA